MHGQGVKACPYKNGLKCAIFLQAFNAYDALKQQQDLAARLKNQLCAESGNPKPISAGTITYNMQVDSTQATFAIAAMKEQVDALCASVDILQAKLEKIIIPVM